MKSGCNLLTNLHRKRRYFNRSQISLHNQFTPGSALARWVYKASSFLFIPSPPSAVCSSFLCFSYLYISAYVQDDYCSSAGILPFTHVIINAMYHYLTKSLLEAVTLKSLYSYQSPLHARHLEVIASKLSTRPSGPQFVIDIHFVRGLSTNYIAVMYSGSLALFERSDSATQRLVPT